MTYQPKTGQPCHCRSGQQRDNCPDCEGTGQRIDFAAIRAHKAEGVTRYVATHINREGMRTLTCAQQGRHTFATQGECDAWLAAMIANNSRDTLAQIHGEQAIGTFETRACECWPGHFDPKGRYFD